MARLAAITGATGFVGSATARYLAQAGWDVRILARRMPQAALLPGRSIEVVLGDLDDRGSLRKLVTGCDAIVHCAGLVRALDPADFFEVNEGGTVRLLEAAALAAPDARLVHVSSLAAREPGLSPYAASKRRAEERVAELAGKRDWVLLRPPAVYGPGDLELLPLFKAAHFGFLAYPAVHGARFSTIHVADLASAIGAVLDAAGDVESRWAGRTFEIDDGAPPPGGHDWTSIVSALAQCTGRTVRSCRLPRPVMVTLAAGLTLASRLAGTPQVLSLAKVPELYHRDWVVSGPKLGDMVNWRPCLALMDGFADTLRWYREKHLIQRKIIP